MFNQIRWRLALLNVVVLTFILAVLEVGIYVILSRSIYDRVDATLIARADQVLRSVQLREPGRSIALPLRAAGAASEGLFYLILDEKGLVLINPQSVALEDIAADKSPLEAALANDSDLRTITLTDGQRIRLYSTVLRTDSGRVAAILQVGRPLASEEHALHMVQLLFVGGGLLGVLLAAVGGLFMASRALVPIRVAFQRQQDFVADASHELRTPLTLIRANAETVLRHEDAPVSDNADLLQDVLKETDRLASLVTDMLTLARADAGQECLAKSEISLGEMVRDVGKQFSVLAADRGILLSIDAAANVNFSGDGSRLRQLLVILLDNALKYTASGGQVTVRSEISHSPGRQSAVLIVSDTGSGIAPEHLPHVFERFYRADPARQHDGSAGIGLAIAQWIAEAHGGKIEVASKLGVGTTFTVTLPMS